MPSKWTACAALAAAVCTCLDLAAAPRDVQIRTVNLQTGVVEIFNFGSTAEALNGWQFCSHDENQRLVYSSFVGLNGVSLASGASLFIHLQNDAPPDASHLNASRVGSFAGPLDAGPYSLSLYFAPVNFNNGNTMADHVQWSIDGLDDSIADERSDEAQSGGVWTDQNAWVSTSDATTEIRLADADGNVLHGPADYTVSGGSTGDVPFHRGDPSDDGVLDIGDPLLLVRHIFLGAAEPSCLEAGNPDDDADIDIADAVLLLEFLFLAGAPPADPGAPPRPCGEDPDGSDLGCAGYESCSSP